MKIDPKFTQSIQEWLAKETKDGSDAVHGAELLVRINPRNVSYRRWMSLAIQRPAYILPKIEHELGIHLKYRLDGLTRQEVVKLDATVVPEAWKILAEGVPEKTTGDVPADGSSDEGETKTIKQLGRRPDHDTLPYNIKQLWDDNGELYKQIKAIFEELKSMNDLPSCQRYDKLKMLAAWDEKYLKQMEQYDNYVAAPDSASVADVPADASAASAADQKEVTNARSYISKNQQKLADLFAAAHTVGADEKAASDYQSLLAKMQQRVDVLIAANAVISDDLRLSLESVGLKLTTDES